MEIIAYLGKKGSFFWGIMMFASFTFLLMNPSLADRVLSTSTGMTFGQNSREPKYKIEFHSVGLPFRTKKDLETITMSNNERKKYRCFLPMVEQTKSLKPVVRHNTSNIIVGTERGTKSKTPDELIAVLRDTCVQRQESWWYYEFCHLKKMRQYHVADEKIIQEFILGVFDSEATAAFHQNHSDISILKDPRSRDASHRYHAHIYTNGTPCDLTNQPRETEVQFVCSELAVIISSIKEISTCKCAVTIQCPMLCKHPMFQRERPTSHVIHCNELPQETKDSELDSHTDKQIITVSNNDEKNTNMTKEMKILADITDVYAKL